MTHDAETVNHNGFLGLYQGPIKEGMRFIWEPNREHAREVVNVVRIQDREHDEPAIWTCNKVWNEESRFREAVVALPPQEVSVKDAAKVLLSDATIAEKVEMNHAGVVAMFPGGWDISQKIAFDKGRIAALRAISEGE